MHIKYCILGFIFIITGCTTPINKTPPLIPKPIREPIQAEEPTHSVSKLHSTTTVEKTSETRFQVTPSISSTSQTTTATKLGEPNLFPHFPHGGKVSVNVEGLPVPAFINEVFGNLLGLSFEIDAPVQRKRELITLKVKEAQKPEHLYSLARQVLGNYKIAIESQGDFFRFVQARRGQQVVELPSMVVQGLALPEVPPSHRPIFQFVPLKIVNYNQVENWVKKIYADQPIEVSGDRDRNAIVLIGPPKMVKQAAKVISLLDQPNMRGKYTLKIEPAFLSARELAHNLNQILLTQGYSSSQTPTLGNIIIFPIEKTNVIIVFASDLGMLTYVQKWAEQLDQVNFNSQQQTAKQQETQLFFYPLRNTKAEELAKTLQPVVQEMRSNNKKKPKSLLVDTQRNALLFIGTLEEWGHLLPILKQMDQPPKQVLIEATLAEIMLSDTDQRGIEWVLNSANLGDLKGELGTLGGLGIGGSGLTYVLRNAAQFRAVLNAFASSSRATILSTPRLMVRSGTQATINVGTEIPTLTSQVGTDLQQGGNTALLQQVQYRRTGIILNITPTVYPGRRVDLKIDQQISDAVPNETSGINSPAISNRQISTELSLSDGHSVLLGGLISNNYTEGTTGVPILSDIPILGQLFRVDKRSSTRNELIIMIVPYVIDGDQEAKAITEAFQNRLELIPALNTPEPQSQEKIEKKPAEPPEELSTESL